MSIKDKILQQIGWAMIVVALCLAVWGAIWVGNFATSVAPEPSATILAEDGSQFLPAVAKPLPTPLPPPLPEVIIKITPDGGINASTFTSGSFQIESTAGNSVQISQIRFDLSTAILMDVVFDPYGIAGDFVAKDFTIDWDTGVGVIGYSLEGFHEDGYDQLVINFANFDPADQLHFSIDVDHNSIRNVPAPGPNESGSVSGLELIGSTITVVFSDGQTVMGQMYRLPDSLSGSMLILRAELPIAPNPTVVGLPTLPVTVTEANQVVQIAGTAGQRLSLLVVEAGLFTEGLPGGGFDIDPFEANSVVQVQEYLAIVGVDGWVEIPITLTKSGEDAGINHLVATFKNHYNMTGSVSAPLILVYAP